MALDDRQPSAVEKTVLTIKAPSNSETLLNFDGVRTSRWGKRQEDLEN
jgi:hypothetical protein